ncbi:hypothetical protein SFR_3842 [Streptomyces sp. FR-008]|nr:hypothetical protein SFR_3842 [Streptomyces sp. FR-008]
MHEPPPAPAPDLAATALGTRRGGRPPHSARKRTGPPVLRSPARSLARGSGTRGIRPRRRAPRR